MSVPPELRVEVLPALPTWAKYPIAQVRQLRAIRRIAASVRPAVVHAYFFWSIIYGRLLKALGVACVLVENREDQGFSWGLHEYGLLRLTARFTDRVVCVSAAVRQTVLEREQLDSAKVVVIPNGVDVAKVSAVEPARAARLRSELALEGAGPIVGMVAHLNREVKGGRYLIDAIPLIREKVPSARFLLVGIVADDLRERVHASGLGDAVVFAGMRKSALDFYPLMDVSVLTSLSEGLSMTLLESMSHGLPVVATAVGGNPEVVVHGETGWLVPPRDPGAFADRVVDLLLDPTLRERMGRAGRERVVMDFGIDRVADAYQRLYADLLS
jgi:glycosyltransferase involved in cell wall biosynthesis